MKIWACLGQITPIKNWQILPISNPKPDLHNINAHTKFGENPLMFTQVIIRKRKTDRCMSDGPDGQTDGLTDDQSETIIPRHCGVAGYKNVFGVCLSGKITIIKTVFVHLWKGNKFPYWVDSFLEGAWCEVKQIGSHKSCLPWQTNQLRVSTIVPLIFGVSMLTSCLFILIFYGLNSQKHATRKDCEDICFNA